MRSPHATGVGVSPQGLGGARAQAGITSATPSVRWACRWPARTAQGPRHGVCTLSTTQWQRQSRLQRAAATALHHSARRGCSRSSTDPTTSASGAAAAAAIKGRPRRGATPMMTQYLDVKSDPRYVGHIVFFQMGEFYEMFFEDAKTASAVLGITLTARGRHKGDPIPMCGVPIRSRDTYIGRLIQAGHKVVVCDQVESREAAQRRGGASELVLRRVTRVITAGTLTEDSMLQARTHNYLCALSVAPAATATTNSDNSGSSATGATTADEAPWDSGPSCGLAWVDLSTGSFVTSYCPAALVHTQLAAMPPAEILVPASVAAAPPPQLAPLLAGTWVGVEECSVTVRDDDDFDRGTAAERLSNGLAVHGRLGAGAGGQHTIAAMTPGEIERQFAPEEAAAASAAVAYVEWTQGGAVPALSLRGSVASSTAGSADAARSSVPGVGHDLLHDRMVLDPATRRSLELVRPLSGRARGPGSLLHLLDRCATAAGSRLMEARLSAPLTSTNAINRRLDAVEWLVSQPAVCDVARSILQRCGDLERCLQRVAIGRASPKDLAVLRDTLALARQLGLLLASQDHVRAAAEDFHEFVGLDNADSEAVAAVLPDLALSAGAGDGAGPVRDRDGDRANEEMVARVLRRCAVDFDDGSTDGLGTADVRGLPRVLANCAEAVLMPLAPSRAVGAADDDAAGDGDADGDRGSPLVAAHTLLRAALVDDPPSGAFHEGGFIRPGYSDELDECIGLRDDSRRLVDDLQAQLRAETGITTLRIRRTAEHGYAVEVPTRHADSLRFREATGAAPTAAATTTAGGPGHGTHQQQPQFVHVKTLKNSTRFKTATLAALDRDIHDAAAKAARLEMAIFRDLCDAATAAASQITAVSRALAVTDVSVGLAEVVGRHALCRPVVVDDDSMHVTRGRHVVVESSLLHRTNPDGSGHALPSTFVPNDVRFAPSSRGDDGDGDGDGHASPGRVWLITGPNMGGKSTFLRQTAHTAILAQMGCFVPADAAVVGVVDRLFSRVGASDDVSRHRSTFYVEMSETAHILREATPRSLVIVDEVGRGTSTRDGLAIAWAVLEELCRNIRCRCLFATHFHELAALALAPGADLAPSSGDDDTLGAGTTSVAADRAVAPDALPLMRCMTMGVHETVAGPVLAYRVVPGTADKSYGLQVARMAGVPPSVVARAQQVLLMSDADDGL